MDGSDDNRSERLDQYVIRQLPALSRSAAAVLIEAGRVSVNGKTDRKPAYRVKAGDEIKIDYDEKNPGETPRVELPVLYEDDDCVVIDKPAGMLTHSKGAFNAEATVATWLSAHVSGMEGERAGIVHRLDRATSGVMICAKTPEALQWLQKQFSERKVKKSYVAAVKGVMKDPEAIIDMPIERNPKRPQTFRTGPNGKPARTAYKVIGSDDRHSLLDLEPATGRTHQLRVHLSQIGHPIVGDTLYGGPPAERLFLHARALELTLPNKQRKTFEVPVPVMFKELV